jgi:mannitol-specific phosphotransferase system IIBC component
MGKRRSQPCSCCVFSLSPGAYIAMHSGVLEREAMRRKLLVLFVAFASVFGVVACTGGVEIEEEAAEEAEEAQQEAQQVQQEERQAEEELKEAEQAAEQEEQGEEELQE